MPLLPTFQLPLPPNAPPYGYGYEWEEDSASSQSRTSAFATGISERDTFLGAPRCVVCGLSPSLVLRHCHIIAKSEPKVWKDLKDRNWIPHQAKNSPGHEPRNGLLMCPNHHILFDQYRFYIRFLPGASLFRHLTWAHIFTPRQIRKYVFINHSDHPGVRQFHKKAIALDMKNRYALFPSSFITHEMRVRGFNPFSPDNPDMPDDVQWQDWILSEGVFNEESGCFNRDGPPRNVIDSVSVQSQLEFQPATTGEGGATLSGRTLPPLNENIIADILAATRSSESWKACVMEGTSWTGTAEENIDKYGSSVGLEGPPLP